MTHAAACDEVANLIVGDVLPELRQRGRVVGAGESADRHDGGAGFQLQAAGGHRSDAGCGPTVVGRLDESRELGVVGLGTTGSASIAASVRSAGSADEAPGVRA